MMEVFLDSLSAYEFVAYCILHGSNEAGWLAESGNWWCVVRCGAFAGVVRYVCMYRLRKEKMRL